MRSLRSYILVTGAYWGFTLTDGALRMLVLLHFHELGYSPIALAFLFLFYEFFGIVTNLLGGVIASRMGLGSTLIAGLLLQVVALTMLSFVDASFTKVGSVVFVMCAQALSGIAKDLTKMSSKSTIKLLIPDDAQSSLFKWVAILTGSKNALKGAGFFLGGLLLSVAGFKWALWGMAGGLLLVLLLCVVALPHGLGKAKGKTKLSGIFSKSRSINLLSGARFFLFGARDIWFVVSVPVFLSSVLDWNFTEVGSFSAVWVIGYGLVQAVAPTILRIWTRGRVPRGLAATVLAGMLTIISASMALGLGVGLSPTVVVMGGLTVFGVVFALSSSVHSYLVLAYSDGDKVALNVGFYYMANAGGRLVGTLLSGILYEAGALGLCLSACAGFTLLSAVISSRLPRDLGTTPMSAIAPQAGGD